MGFYEILARVGAFRAPKKPPAKRGASFIQGATPMPALSPGVTLEVKASLDLPSAYELGEDVRAIIKAAVVKGIRDGLREAGVSVDKSLDK
jgi:hypothetical protein